MSPQPIHIDDATLAYLKSLPPEYLAENNSGQLFRLAIAFACVLTIFIILFYISQWLHNSAKSIEAWCLMPLSYVFCMVHCVVCILLVKMGGVGRHWPELILHHPERIATAYELEEVEGFIYMASITFPKLAVLALYMRIFTMRPYRIAVYITGGTIILNCIGGMIAHSILCAPFTFSWERTTPGGICGNNVAAYLWFSVLNVVTDVVMLVLPMPALYKLRVELAVKIGLFFTFICGSFGLVTAIIRTVWFFRINLDADGTYKGTYAVMWTLVEPSMYLITACLPALRPLKRRLFPDLSFTKFVSKRLGKYGTQQSWKIYIKSNAEMSQGITGNGTSVLQMQRNSRHSYLELEGRQDESPQNMSTRSSEQV